MSQVYARRPWGLGARHCYSVAAAALVDQFDRALCGAQGQPARVAAEASVAFTFYRLGYRPTAAAPTPLHWRPRHLLEQGALSEEFLVEAWLLYLMEAGIRLRPTRAATRGALNTTCWSDRVDARDLVWEVAGRTFSRELAALGIATRRDIAEPRARRPGGARWLTQPRLAEVYGHKGVVSGVARTAYSRLLNEMEGEDAEWLARAAISGPLAAPPGTPQVTEVLGARRFAYTQSKRQQGVQAMWRFTRLQPLPSEYMAEEWERQSAPRAGEPGYGKWQYLVRRGEGAQARWESMPAGRLPEHLRGAARAMQANPTPSNLHRKLAGEWGLERLRQACNGDMVGDGPAAKAAQEAAKELVQVTWDWAAAARPAKPDTRHVSGAVEPSFTLSQSDAAAHSSHGTFVPCAAQELFIGTVERPEGGGKGKLTPSLEPYSPQEELRLRGVQSRAVRTVPKEANQADLAFVDMDSKLRLWRTAQEVATDVMEGCDEEENAAHAAANAYAADALQRTAGTDAAVQMDTEGGPAGPAGSTPPTLDTRATKRSPGPPARDRPPRRVILYSCYRVAIKRIFSILTNTNQRSKTSHLSLLNLSTSCAVKDVIPNNVYLGTVFILRKVVLRVFRTTHPPT